MKAYISKRVLRAAQRIDARWRERADHPDLFARELVAAVEMLETTMGVGAPCPTRKHPSLRRLLLSKSRCHVYFTLDSDRDQIRVMHIWDGRREHAPAL